MSLFHQQKEFSTKQGLLWALLGFIIVLLAWWGAAELLSRERAIVDFSSDEVTSSISSDSLNSQDFTIYRDSIFEQDSIKLANATEFEKIYPLLPPPNRVLKAFPALYQNDALFSNTWISIWRNLQGYFWAVFLAILIGFPIGLVPTLKALFGKQIDAMRYLPLTALTGLFILWFGIGDSMKVAFLAFGILVYLLPIVMQRIKEVESVYIKTTFTLGANDWQTIKTVYLPSVFSKLIDDIRVLTAISWTYIIIAELLNRKGGVGAMLWINSKQGKVDKVFAWLFVIIIVGFLQDRLFVYLDKRLFPHKYYKTVFYGLKEVQYGVLLIIGSILMFILAGIIIPSAMASIQSLLFIIIITGFVVILYGEFKFQRSNTE